MKRMMGVSLLICFLFGCVKPGIYHWENYSSSLYELKKTPNDENLKAHKEVLLKIIQRSTEDKVRVPPGIYCEYGYILMKEGKAEEALTYYQLEEQTYPESAIFIQKLKDDLDKNEKE